MFSKPIDLIDLVYLTVAITGLTFVIFVCSIKFYESVNKWQLKEAEFHYQCSVMGLEDDER